jgi:hypothetical protein
MSLKQAGTNLNEIEVLAETVGTLIVHQRTLQLLVKDGTHRARGGIEINTIEGVFKSGCTGRLLLSRAGFVSCDRTQLVDLVANRRNTLCHEARAAEVPAWSHNLGLHRLPGHSIDNLVAVLHVGFNQAAARPVQHVEDHQVGWAGSDGHPHIRHAGAQNVIGSPIGLDGV